MKQTNTYFCDKVATKYHLANLKTLEEKDDGLFHYYLPNHACQIKVHKVLIMNRTAYETYHYRSGIICYTGAILA